MLPFESQAPEDAYFAAGIAYDLLIALDKISSLLVFGRPSVPDGDRAPGASGAELRLLTAQYVLGGTVRRIGPRVRVTATLVETSSGRQVWAERYDGTDDGLHVTLDAIVEEIVTGLRAELVEGDQARIWNRALRNPQARDRFYQGAAHFWRMTPEQLALARERFREVMELEAGSTIGYAYTAWTHLFELFLGFSADPARSRALAAEYCQRALDIDVDGLSLHSLRGHLHLLSGEGEQAIACSETALRLRPSCGLAYAFLAHALLHVGRPREAIARIQMAFRRSRVTPPWYHEVLGWAYLFSGFHEQAATTARSALQADQGRIEPQLLLAAALRAQGRTADAHACIERLWRWHPEFDLAAFVAAKPGRGAEMLGQALAWIDPPGA